MSISVTLVLAHAVSAYVPLPQLQAKIALNCSTYVEVGTHSNTRCPGPHGVPDNAIAWEEVPNTCYLVPKSGYEGCVCRFYTDYDPGCDLEPDRVVRWVQDDQHQIQGTQSGKCVETKELSNGQRPFMSDCLDPFNEAFPQHWSFYFGQLVPARADMYLGSTCLDVSDGDLTNGNFIQIWDCLGLPQQQFSYDNATGLLRVAGTDMCVAAVGGGMGPEDPLWIWQCSEEKAEQIWQQKSSGPEHSGAQHIVSASGNSFCIGAGLPENVANGDKLSMDDCSGGGLHCQQLWNLFWGQLVFGRTVNASGDQSGFKCADVPYGDLSNSNVLQIWDCLGLPQQQFHYSDDGSIRIAGSNKCVESSSGEGAPWIWDCNGGPDQQWSLKPAAWDQVECGISERYTCDETSGQCVLVPREAEGALSEAQCEHSCKQTVYACVDNQCVEASSGTPSLNTCHEICNPSPPAFL